MEDIQVMDDATFRGIYTNEDLRNEVAFAHGCNNSNNEFMYKVAMMYPVSYIVTEEQIRIAKEVREKRKEEVLRDHKNSLLFRGMGTEFEPTFKDGVGNYRIRTEFLNSKGVRCFIEVCKGKGENLTVDHAMCPYIDESSEQKYNYHDLERNSPGLKYTYANVLKLVNEEFDCNFETMVVDNYNLSCDDGVICRSPKSKIGEVN